MKLIPVQRNQKNPKNAAFQIIPPLTTEIGLMKFTGSTRILIYIHWKDFPLVRSVCKIYLMIKINVNENELQTLFQQIEMFIAEGFILTLPNRNHPFFINVDFPSTGICRVHSKR